jgi:sortase A
MRKVIGAVGRACITAGILILLFVVYQLWGTGIYEARAQDDLRGKFESQLEEEKANSNSTTTTTTTVPGTPTDPSATSTTTTTTTPADDSTSSSTTSTTAPLPTGASPPIPPAGEPVGIINIPKIGLDRVIVEGVSVPDLRMGPGHYPGTPLPGQLGNAAIAGHRTTYGAPFNRLDELDPGDEILVQTLQGNFRYRVTEEIVVDPSQIEVLDPTPDRATLTLTTCNPKYSAAQRLVVKAEYTGPTFPPAEGTGNVRPASLAGLSGADESRTPVYLWGFLTVIVGGLWWLAFHRYPRWPAWLAGVVPFLVVLFVFYVYLERLLPSNY